MLIEVSIYLKKERAWV